MTASPRLIRFITSVSLAALVLSQLPLGSLFSSPALGQGAPVYTGSIEEKDEFLGIDGLSGMEAFQIVGGIVLASGIKGALTGGGSANAAAASAGGSATAAPPTGNANALPDPSNSGDEKSSLFESLRADPGKRFKQFTNIAELNEIRSTPLEDQLNAPYTCFAPTDGAFNQLSGADRVKLTDKQGIGANKADNQKLLLKHVVLGKYNVRDLEQLEAGFPLATVSGDVLTISKNPDGTANVNGVPVTREDIRASNGVVHPLTSIVH